MLRRFWHFLFGGCMHSYKWRPIKMRNAMVQIGTCETCGYMVERTIVDLACEQEDPTR